MSVCWHVYAATAATTTEAQASKQSEFSSIKAACKAAALSAELTETMLLHIEMLLTAAHRLTLSMHFFHMHVTSAAI